MQKMYDSATDKGQQYAEDHPTMYFPYKAKDTSYAMTRLGLYLNNGKESFLVRPKDLEYALTVEDGILDRDKGRIWNPDTKTKMHVDPIVLDGLMEHYKSGIKYGQEEAKAKKQEQFVPPLHHFIGFGGQHG